MKYKIIKPDQVTNLARALLDGGKPAWSDFELEVGSGTLLAEQILYAIAGGINKQRSLIDEKGLPRENLDAIAFEIIHKGRPSDGDMFGDPRFWTRFALVYLFEVIKWRFPGKGTKGFNLENVGVGSARRQTENYAYKLWIRGDISQLRDQKDPYKLGRFGDVDFWTSHIHRQGFANCRDVAAELIRFQYPPELKGQPRLLPGNEDPSKGKIGIRTLVKRIRRLWATVEYALLAADEIRAILQELSKGLSLADGKSIYS
jgi:hypothetical protein